MKRLVAKQKLTTDILQKFLDERWEQFHKYDCDIYDWGIDFNEYDGKNNLWVSYKEYEKETGDLAWDNNGSYIPQKLFQELSETYDLSDVPVY